MILKTTHYKDGLRLKKNGHYTPHTTHNISVTTVKQPSRKKGIVKGDQPGERFPDPLPTPMMAKLSSRVMDNPSWIYEKKLDGYRMLCGKHNGITEMVSRNGNDYSQKYGILLSDLDKIEEDIIIDGEIVIENPDGLTDFQLLQNYGTTRRGSLKYYVFDILYLNGHNITGFPLIKRKELLSTFFRKYRFKNLVLLDYQIGNGREMFETLSAKGYEGIIAKDPDSVYLTGKRADTWLKIKSSLMQEAIICGYTNPQNSRKYFGSLILGLYDGAKLRYIGNCGTGFNDISLKELYERFELLKTEENPFGKILKLTRSRGKPVWLKPELVCNIKFLEWSRDGIMRSPVFMGLRVDKEAERVINESKPVDKKLQNYVTLNISGKKVKCNNLTKILWPGEGYTKGDLINYYQKISKYMLPYLKDRPQSLNRHPEGIIGENFFQKDIDRSKIPSWMKTAKIYSESADKQMDFLICNDSATLIYMVNLGCIEINPWHSTYLKQDEPTYFILDLDPVNISFIDVVNTALVIKEICDEINVPSYCKTSGTTGLHIFIPLGGQYNYDQAQTIAELLAIIAHSRLPSTTSIEMSISNRRELVYIDFLQNKKGQTIAAPYSVRPGAFATVSTPLNWKEVNHHLDPQVFTIRSIEDRISSKGDLWQPVLQRGINLAKTINILGKLA